MELVCNQKNVLGLAAECNTVESLLKSFSDTTINLRQMFDLRLYADNFIQFMWKDYVYTITGSGSVWTLAGQKLVSSDPISLLWKVVCPNHHMYSVPLHELRTGDLLAFMPGYEVAAEPMWALELAEVNDMLTYLADGTLSRTCSHTIENFIRKQTVTAEDIHTVAEALARNGLQHDLASADHYPIPYFIQAHAKSMLHLCPARISAELIKAMRRPDMLRVRFTAKPTMRVDVLRRLNR